MTEEEIKQFRNRLWAAFAFENDAQVRSLIAEIYDTGYLKGFDRGEEADAARHKYNQGYHD